MLGILQVHPKQKGNSHVKGKSYCIVRVPERGIALFGFGTIQRGILRGIRALVAVRTLQDKRLEVRKGGRTAIRCSDRKDFI
jgi:hypothetical protein